MRRKRGGCRGASPLPPIIFEGGNIPSAPPPNNPPTFSFNVYHKCTNLIYVPFILFEGISKSILFNSNLNFAAYFSILILILLYNFAVLEMYYLALIGGGGSDQLTASEKFAPPPPRPLAPQYSELCPPPHPIVKTFLRL